MIPTIKVFSRCLFIAALFFTLSTVTLGANNIAWSDIFYSYKGENKYEVVLHIYHEYDKTKKTIPSENQISLEIYSLADNSLYKSVTVLRDSAIVQSIAAKFELFDRLIPEDVSIHKSVYKKTILLDPNKAGYTISYTSCCKNSKLANIPPPKGSGTSYSVSISVPGSNLVGKNGRNNSARFTHPALLAIFPGRPFVFNSSAKDADGDSLVYSLRDACSNVLDKTDTTRKIVDWTNTMRPANRYSGSVLYIDQQKGLLSGSALALGLYSIIVVVNEYREGVLINTVTRDAQIEVMELTPENMASPVGKIGLEDVLGGLKPSSTGTEDFKSLPKQGNGENHGAQGGGNGKAGSTVGDNWQLTGRSIKRVPSTEPDSPSTGVVVVDIWVDKNGNVIKAIANSTHPKTTATNLDLYRLAEKKAREAQFNKSDQETQKGSIIFTFK